MKITLINLHSSHNAGDHVLLEVGLQQLYALFPGCRITLVMNDPESYRARPDRGPETLVDSFFAWFKGNPTSGSLARWGHRLRMVFAIGLASLMALLYRLTGWRSEHFLSPIHRATVRAYLDADLIVSCAGNFIYSRGHPGGVALLSPVFIMVYAWLAGKPIAMLPQTIGPLWRHWERSLVRWLVDRIDVVLVRDLTSVEMMQQLGVPANRYHLAPDIAFLYATANRQLGEELLCRYGLDPAQARPLLGVTLINWGAQHPRFKGQARYEAAIATAIRHFVLEHGGHALLFAQVCGPTPAEDDRTPARRVHALLAEPALAGCVTLVDEELPPATLKAAYGSMDLFLGSRLHSNIFALIEQRPVLAIAYQDKTFGVMRMLDLDEWVIAIEEVEAAQLIVRLERLWAQRSSLHQHIADRLPPLQAEARQTLALIRLDTK
jgi:colanic acid/amylovoran biosynthesis protein